jgi:hypothetical protein
MIVTVMTTVTESVIETGQSEMMTVGGIVTETETGSETGETTIEIETGRGTAEIETTGVTETVIGRETETDRETVIETVTERENERSTWRERGTERSRRLRRGGREMVRTDLRRWRMLRFRRNQGTQRMELSWRLSFWDFETSWFYDLFFSAFPSIKL